jgi:hypothetical protein
VFNNRKNMSKISKSVYQKVCEENKRLLNDIRIMCDIENPECVDVTIKWMDKFESDKEFHRDMKIIAAEYIKKHPEYDISKLKKR